MIGKHNIRSIGLRRHSPLKARLSVVPTVLQAAVESGRRDPVRSWYAAAGVMAVVFVVVSSVGVITGRSAHDSYPIMVLPNGPTLPTVPTPGGAPLTLPDGTASGESGQTSTAPHTKAPVAVVSTSPSAPARTHTSPTRSSTPATRPAEPTSNPSPRPPAESHPDNPPPAGSVTARYIVYSSWQDGFTTGFELANHSNTTQTWKVKLVHERADGVRVKELWNATLKQGGATTNVFVGGTLAPGGTLNFGFNASKTTKNAVRPVSCTINNRACSFG